MSPLEIALEQFFNQYRQTAGAFDYVEEGDIFIAQEVLEIFFSNHRFTSTQAQEFLSFFSTLPRIQGIMIFKMPESKLMQEVENVYTKFQTKKSQLLPRVHRMDAIAPTGEKKGQHKVAR